MLPLELPTLHRRTEDGIERRNRWGWSPGEGVITRRILPVGSLIASATELRASRALGRSMGSPGGIPPELNG